MRRKTNSMILITGRLGSTKAGEEQHHGCGGHLYSAGSLLVNKMAGCTSELVSLHHAVNGNLQEGASLFWIK